MDLMALIINYFSTFLEVYMKPVFRFILLGLFLFNSVIEAQINNGGFEDWDANLDPIMWLTNNTTGSFIPVTRTSDAFAGSWAAQGDVVTFSVFTVGPSIIGGEMGEGIPINFRPSAFRGMYKFTSVESDFLQVQANFMKNGVGIGVAANNLSPAANYTEFSIPTAFINSEVPDSVLIAIFVTHARGFPHVGSRVIIDDLSWSGATDINDPAGTQISKYNLEQNFPNPFNPGTKISWQSPIGSHQTLKVYDMLGREVVTLVDEYRTAGSYEAEFDGSQLASGVYYYKLIVGDPSSNSGQGFIETKKMLMIK
ncbi:MAG: T9SS type A sorting domain-containing protein [Ignavibacteriales bacterium]|nr:MAG: T9SS type A sorting domain-containing protein [Ignavibacteriales bacterium]